MEPDPVAEAEQSLVEVVPLQWSARNAVTDGALTVDFGERQVDSVELHINRAEVPPCGVLARVIDLDGGEELLRLDAGHGGRFVTIDAVKRIGLEVVLNSDSATVQARCGQTVDSLLSMVDIQIDSARLFVPTGTESTVDSVAWVLPVSGENGSPWQWHVSRPGATKIEVRVEATETWCGGLVTVTNDGGETVAVGQLGANAFVAAPVGDWFAVRVESKCTNETSPLSVYATATTSIFAQTQPLSIKGPLEVFSDGAPWLSFHGGVSIPDTNDFGPYDRIELLPAAGQRLTISTPTWTPLACAADERVARYLAEEVCDPHAALILSPRPFFVRYRNGNETLVRQVDAGLLIENAESGRPTSPEGLGATSVCDAPIAQQACMRLDESTWAPRLGCRVGDATGRDSDLDLLSDFSERCLSNTDPGDGVDFGPMGGRDTDQDGFSDGWEVCGVADLGWNRRERRPPFAGGPLCRDLLYETLYDTTNRLSLAGPNGPGGYPEVLDLYPVNTFEHLRRGVEPLFLNWLGVRTIEPMSAIADPRLPGRLSGSVVADWAYVPAFDANSCSGDLPECVYVTSTYSSADEEAFVPRRPCPDQAGAHAAVANPRCDDSLRRVPEPQLVRAALHARRTSTGVCECAVKWFSAPCLAAGEPGAITVAMVDDGCDVTVCHSGDRLPDARVCTAPERAQFAETFERRRTPEGSSLPIYGAIVEELLPGVAGVVNDTASQAYTNLSRAYVVYGRTARDRSNIGDPGGARQTVAAHELGHVLGLGHGPFYPNSARPAPLHGNNHPLYDSVMNYIDDTIGAARGSEIRYSAGQRQRFDDHSVSSERLLSPGMPARVGFVSTFVRTDNTPVPALYESGCSAANPCPAGYGCVVRAHQLTIPQFFNPRDPWVCVNGDLCDPSGAACGDGSACTSTVRSSFFTAGECVPASVGADLNGDGVFSTSMAWTDPVPQPPVVHTQGWSLGLLCAWNPLEEFWELLSYGSCDTAPRAGATRRAIVSWDFCRAEVDPAVLTPCANDDACASGSYCEWAVPQPDVSLGLCRPLVPERIAILSAADINVVYTNREGEDAHPAYDTIEFTDASGAVRCEWMLRSERWQFAEHEIDMNDFERMSFAQMPFDLCGIDACDPSLSETSNLFREFDYWPMASPGFHAEDEIGH